MIKLSDRLNIIADRITEGETMADIGTDHGFLPIYLKTTAKSPKVIMADVSKPSLDKARSNASEFDEFSHEMFFRAGDGLTVLKKGEVDTIVIAGMGGKLIQSIMDDDIEHTLSFKKFILQPRIGQGHLRKWLTDNKFKIIYEDLVYEGDYIPEIITAISPKHCNYIHTENYLNKNCGLSNYGGDDVHWKIPPWITEANGPVEEFLNRNIALEKDKLVNIQKARVINKELVEYVQAGIDYLEMLLRKRMI